MSRLNRNFYKSPTLDVARNLLGKELVFNGKKGIITETEAYIGEDDPACHAARGRTKRTEVMFGKAGFSYVYLIYGMYHCLNFVTEKEGFAAAVLIRGILSPEGHFDGPGKLCKYMEITRENNNIDIVNSDFFHVRQTDFQLDFETTPRIGISKGLDKNWRFAVIKESLAGITF